MKRLCTFGTACALGMALTGCMQSPTAPEAGGHTFGSGNLRPVNSTSAQGGGYTIGSGNRTRTDRTGEIGASTGADAATADTAAERGGHTVGSGN
jgi:hypothetical protein